MSNLAKQKVNLSFNRKDADDNWWEAVDLTRLVLANNLLQSVDSRIGELGALTLLDLHGNQLQSLPLEISQLENLLALNLSSNNLILLPDLPRSLKDLNVSFNRLTRLPKSICYLSQLSVLNASNNLLSELEPSIASCDQLRLLDVSHNRLKDLTQVPFGNLAVLQELLLNNNQIHTIFGKDSNIPRLTRIVANHNLLNTFPLVTCPAAREIIFSYNKLLTPGSNTTLLNSCKNLEILDLKCNQLDSIPNEVLRLRNLRRLDISDNNIKVISPELGLLDNLQSVAYT